MFLIDYVQFQRAENFSFVFRPLMSFETNDLGMLKKTLHRLVKK